MRRWTPVAVLAIAAGAAGAVWHTNQRAIPTALPNESLTIGVSRVPHNLPVMAAEAQGFFRRAGLQITFRNYPTGRDALKALLRGEVEVATSAETPIVLQSFAPPRFTVIAAFAHSDSAMKIVARADRGIRTAADLRGRKVALIPGTSAQFFLDMLLVDSDIDRAAVTIVPSTVHQLAPRLVAGEVDAVAAFQPHLSRVSAALAPDARVLIGSERTRTFMSYVVASELPARRPAALARLLGATREAVAWIRDHRTESAAVVAAGAELDPASALLAMEDFHYGVSLNQALVISLEEQARWALQRGLAPAKARLPNYLDFLDPSLLAELDPAAVTVIR